LCHLCDLQKNDQLNQGRLPNNGNGNLNWIANFIWDIALDSIWGRFDVVINGKPRLVEYEPDPDLRDTEQVPLQEDEGIEAFLRREVLPYAADAWYDADILAEEKGD